MSEQGDKPQRDHKETNLKETTRRQTSKRPQGDKDELKMLLNEKEGHLEENQEFKNAPILEFLSNLEENLLTVRCPRILATRRQTSKSFSGT